MVQIKVEDLSKVDCGGGYGDGECVFIDRNLPKESQKLILIHEVIENSARHHRVDHKVIHIRHDRLDLIAAELLDAIKQWEGLSCQHLEHASNPTNAITS